MDADDCDNDDNVDVERVDVMIIELGDDDVLMTCSTDVRRSEADDDDNDDDGDGDGDVKVINSPTTMTSFSLVCLTIAAASSALLFGVGLKLMNV